LGKFKLCAVTPWVELPQNEVELLATHTTLPLLEPPEDCELLVSRVPFKFKKLLDKNAEEYHVIYDQEEKLTKLYGKTPALKRFRSNENY
jgi:squalene cyclase